MIRIEQVTKKFGKLCALDQVDLALDKGECVALIGPNGCGKTTLIKTVLGMVIPTEGQIEFDGQNIAQHWQYRSDIGYMPQIGRYPENMTIGQVLDMMKDIRKTTETGKLDLDMVEAFEIEALLDKRMGTLSGGTRQKVSACLAFMFDPKVLILDEPTAGLDPVSTELLKTKIRREKDKDKLVIITSHVLSELDDLVTQVIYMFEGKPLFHKTIEQLRMDTGESTLSRAIAQIMNQQNPINVHPI